MYTWRQFTKYTEVILALRSEGYLMEARGMASRRQPIQETMAFPTAGFVGVTIKSVLIYSNSNKI